MLLSNAELELVVTDMTWRPPLIMYIPYIYKTLAPDVVLELVIKTHHR
jgi:hypothetical protein